MRKNFGVHPWFYPLPVLIIGTYDENGNADAMNAAWGGLYESNLVELCLSEGHKTTQNILTKKAFTISFGTEDTVVACDYVGLVSAHKEPNKLSKAGFNITHSHYVDAPIISELPMCLECEFVRQTQEGNIIGKIVNINADEKILDEKGNIDVQKLKPISFDPVKNEYVSIGNGVGHAFSDGNRLKGE